MEKNPQQKYYETHKDIWNKKKICEICGAQYSHSTKYRHFKSKKHMLAEKEKRINDLEQQISILKEK